MQRNVFVNGWRHCSAAARGTIDRRPDTVTLSDNLIVFNFGEITSMAMNRFTDVGTVSDRDICKARSTRAPAI